MYQRFIELQSTYSHEIINKGIVLYENNNEAMRIQLKWLDNN